MSSGEIYDIKYDIDNAKIYGENALLLAQKSVSNSSDQPTSVTFQLRYDDVRFATWNDSSSLKSRVTPKTHAAIPLIVDGKVVISDEIQQGIEFGVTYTKNIPTYIGTIVSVPPKSYARITLVTRQGTCDVPFTYKRKNILSDGSSAAINEYHGTFTGSNFYSTRFNVEFEPL